MKNETIKVNGYVELIRLFFATNNDCDMLIDFHDNKKWLSSKNITVTLIPHEEGVLFRDYKTKRGHFVRKKSDNSILYVCNVHGRYEYFLMNDWGNNIFWANNVSEYEESRDDYIASYNNDFDILIDNGKAKEYYDTPSVECHTPLGRINSFYYKESSEDNGEMIITQKEAISTDAFIIEARSDGGHYLLDKDTREIKYICNIGGRYEYYFEKKYPHKFLNYNWDNNDVLVYLKPDKEDVYTPIITLIDPNNNPYLVRERNDGGVDLLSKVDNSLKYVCNIGKRFYYTPHVSGNKE